MIIFHKKRKKTQELSPDEVLLDSRNFPGFNQNQMEGRLEMLLRKRVAFFVFLFFIAVMSVMIIQLVNLQIRNGEVFRERAFLNRMERHVLLPERGGIRDRNGKEIVWNDARFRIIVKAGELPLFEQKKDILTQIFSPSFSFDDILKDTNSLSRIVLIDGISWEDAEQVFALFPDTALAIETTSVRRYIEEPGFSHLVGYTAFPDNAKEKGESSIKIGKTGIEQYFDSVLRGTPGLRLVETDAKGNIVSESIQQDEKNGNSLSLTVDADIQAVLYSTFARIAEERGFRGGAGILFDIGTGEIFAMTSFPEFDANIFLEGISNTEFQKILHTTRAPFFPRALEGEYLPGSIFKPVLAFAALNDGIISPEKEIFSSGSISLPNPYQEGQFSVFKDWKAHGWTDMRHALAVSSNVYFYTIGGGFDNQKGIGAERIHDYAKLFGFGAPIFENIPNAEGHVPDPSESEFWRVGDTYNFSIGQGGLKVTLLQIARFLGIIAQNGKVPAFHFIKENEEENRLVKNYPLPDVMLPQEYFDVVHEGMRLAVQQGTAQALSGLGVPFAGKTGTAEIGAGRVNSWFMGYAPYNNPRLGIAIVFESGDEKNLVGAASAAREVMQWIIQNRPEYIK